MTKDKTLWAAIISVFVFWMAAAALRAASYPSSRDFQIIVGILTALSVALSSISRRAAAVVVLCWVVLVLAGLIWLAQVDLHLAVMGAVMFLVVGMICLGGWVWSLKVRARRRPTLGHRPLTLG